MQSRANRTGSAGKRSTTGFDGVTYVANVRRPGDMRLLRGLPRSGCPQGPTGWRRRSPLPNHAPHRKHTLTIVCIYPPDRGGKCTRCRITGQRSYHMPHRSRRWRRRRGSGREGSTTSRPFLHQGKTFLTSERRTRQGNHECVRTTRMRRGNYACIGITMRVSVQCRAWTRATGQCGARVRAAGQCGARIRAAGNRRRAHESGAGHAAGVRWRRRPSGSPSSPRPRAGGRPPP